MKQKRVWSMCLVLCLVLAVMFPAVLAVETKAAGSCGGALTWSFDESTGTLTISGEGDMYNYYYIENYAPWYSVRKSISNVVIESGVTSIGEFAFYDCTMCSMAAAHLPM